MIRVASLLLTVLTGFSGLVYEVTWQKCLATLLGSHSEATAAVLGIYLGGLAVGYSLFGKVTAALVRRAQAAGRPAPLLRTYGAVEGAIGLWALAFPALFSGVQALSLALPHTHPGLGFAVDVGLTILLIGPPTIMMGGTIPILTQALADDLEDATRVHAFIYAFNTAGAFFGALAAGFFLIPTLGIHGVLYWMGLLNLAAGLGFGLMGLRARRGAALPASSEPTPSVEGLVTYYAVALLLGYAMMAAQTALIRIGGLALGASHFTFSMVVAVFVLCIALGSFAVSALSRIPPVLMCGALWVLGALLGLLYFQLPDVTYYAHVLRTLFVSHDAAFYPFHGAAFVLVLLALAAPVGIAGASLPLLFHHLRNQIGELGHVAGRLYSWNTVGSLLGALLGGYLLLFWLDLDQVYRTGIVAVLVAAVLLTQRVMTEWNRSVVLVAGVSAVAAAVVLPTWSPLRLSAGLYRLRDAQPASYVGADRFFDLYATHGAIDMYTDDPTSSVAVKSYTVGNRLVRSIYTNGKSDGSLGGDYPTMALVAHIPCMIATECRSSFVIGYGTGVTAGELAAIETMERVVVAEISDGVVEAAPLFDYGNRYASKSPKLEMIRSDAYRALLRADETFDVIASEPSNPWMMGVEMLFSREFLEAARDRLRPGGVYAQWIHVYETDRATLELVLRTYAEVFDHVSVWFTLQSDLLLLGHMDDSGTIDVERMASRSGKPGYRGGLRRSRIEDVPELLAHELLPLGVVHAGSREGEIHTLLHPVLSHRAARAFYRGEQAELPTGAHADAASVGGRSSVLRRYLEGLNGAGTPPEDALYDRIAEGACVMGPSCASVLARWAVDHPDSELRTKRLARLRRGSDWADEHLGDDRLAVLAELHRGRAPDAGLSPAEAGLRTRLFGEYYHHAFPFPRESLAQTWDACLPAGPRCERGRQAAVRQLGAF